MIVDLRKANTANQQGEHTALQHKKRERTVTRTRRKFKKYTQLQQQSNRQTHTHTNAQGPRTLSRVNRLGQYWHMRVCGSGEQRGADELRSEVETSEAAAATELEPGTRKGEESEALMDTAGLGRTVLRVGREGLSFGFLSLFWGTGEGAVGRAGVHCSSTFSGREGAGDGFRGDGERDSLTICTTRGFDGGTEVGEAEAKRLLSVPGNRRPARSIGPFPSLAAAASAGGVLSSLTAEDTLPLSSKLSSLFCESASGGGTAEREPEAFEATDRAPPVTTRNVLETTRKTQQWPRPHLNSICGLDCSKTPSRNVHNRVSHTSTSIPRVFSHSPCTEGDWEEARVLSGFGGSVRVGTLEA